MSANPLFSIVITTTRPRLLKFALASALSQDFDDFEVIVSDNSDSGCEDIVASFESPRVRYFRPDGYMTVVDHWNYAFSHASGEWQVLLCDDHVFVPRLLSIVKETLQHFPEADTIIWDHAVHYDDEWGDNGPSKQFVVPPITGRCRRYGTAKIIRQMFKSGTGLAGEVKRKVPLVTNAMYSRRAIRKVRDACGYLFSGICPMTSAALAVLTMTRYTVKIDMPLYILGTPVDSASGHVKDATTYNQMNAQTNFRHVPIKTMALFPTISTETILRVREMLPEHLGHYEIDWLKYFIACKGCIEELEQQGKESSQERSLWQEALTNQSYRLKRKLQEKSEGKMVGIIRNNLSRIKYLIAQQKFKRHPDSMFRGRSFDTDAEGLVNIGDCVAFLDKLMFGVSPRVKGDSGNSKR